MATALYSLVGTRGSSNAPNAGLLHTGMPGPLVYLDEKCDEPPIPRTVVSIPWQKGAPSLPYYWKAGYSHQCALELTKP